MNENQWRITNSEQQWLGSVGDWSDMVYDVEEDLIWGDGVQATLER